MNWDALIARELLVKIALLPLVPLLLCAVLRRRSAAAQHLVLVTGLAAVVLLPISVLIVPSWQLEIPEGPLQAVAWTSIERSGPASATPATDGSSASRAPTLPAWLLAWLVGVATVGGRWMLAIRSSRRIVDEAERSRSPALRGLASRLADEAGVHRPFELLCGGNRQMPFTSGWLRPTLILPKEAETWDRQTQEMVLAHELAHIRRCDVAAQALAAAATSIYWFHPLVWWMASRLRSTAERAADDAVVSLGAKPADYADSLLRLARRYKGLRTLTAAAANARFEARLEALLATGRRRGPVAPSRYLAALLGTAAIVAVVSGCGRTDAAHETPKAERPQILIEALIVETDEPLVNWSAVGQAARGDQVNLLLFGAESQSLEERLLQAERDGRLEILASPKILTLNGAQASVQTGLQVPVQTTTGDTTTTQYVNATLRLDVMPQMVEDSDSIVELELAIQKRFPRPELAQASSVNAPISTTEARTTFQLRLGGTVVIAGMRDSSREAGDNLIVFVTLRQIQL